MNEIETLKRRIEELERFVRDMENVTTVPLNVDRALRARLSGSDSGNSLQLSNKSSSSENLSQSVNEAGAATYTINYTNQPDGFLQIDIAGVVYYLPFYS